VSFGRRLNGRSPHRAKPEALQVKRAARAHQPPGEWRSCLVFLSGQASGIGRSGPRWPWLGFQLELECVRQLGAAALDPADVAAGRRGACPSIEGRAAAAGWGPGAPPGRHRDPLTKVRRAVDADHVVVAKQRVHAWRDRNADRIERRRRTLFFGFDSLPYRSTDPHRRVCSALPRHAPAGCGSPSPRFEGNAPAADSAASKASSSGGMNFTRWKSAATRIAPANMTPAPIRTASA
jgi:hypothetical protein